MSHICFKSVPFSGTVSPISNVSFASSQINPFICDNGMHWMSIFDEE